VQEEEDHGMAVMETRRKKKTHPVLG